MKSFTGPNVLRIGCFPHLAIDGCLPLKVHSLTKQPHNGVWDGIKLIKQLSRKRLLKAAA